MPRLGSRVRVSFPAPKQKKSWSQAGAFFVSAHRNNRAVPFLEPSYRFQIARRASFSRKPLNKRPEVLIFTVPLSRKPGTPIRRGARVVESGGLENRCASNRTVGSNPTLSAGKSDSHNNEGRFFHFEGWDEKPRSGFEQWRSH